MRRRGAYAKGIAKREEILERALEVIARDGYDGASIRAIADAVDLTQAGVLHYFDSKEELYTEVLRKRDMKDRARFWPTFPDVDAHQAQEGYLGLMRHNASVPGLVELFSRMSVDAAAPDHPAHEFFLERGHYVRDMFIRAYTGHVRPSVDVEALAKLIQATADGVQLQWLLDPTIDLVKPVEALFASLSRYVLQDTASAEEADQPL